MADNRLIVITGGAGGMGLACAEAFKDEGPILLCDVKEEPVNAAAEALRKSGADVQGMVCDVSNPDQVTAVAKEVGEHKGLRALAHTAGLSPMMTDGKRILEVNLVGTALLLDALTPHIGEGTAAVLVASQAGTMAALQSTPEANAVLDDPLQENFIDRLTQVAGQGAIDNGYGFSKWGVQRMAVSLAPAWGAKGARIVSLSPGIIDTPMGQFEYERQPIMKDIVAATPAGRMGRSSEIASALKFLCSDAASFVTGVDLLVDGGSTNQLMRAAQAGAAMQADARSIDKAN